MNLPSDNYYSLKQERDGEGDEYDEELKKIKYSAVNRNGPDVEMRCWCFQLDMKLDDTFVKYNTVLYRCHPEPTNFK